MTPWPSATGASRRLTSPSSESTARYVLSSTGPTRRMTARIFLTRRRASWMASSLSGSPILFSSDTAMSSCRRTIRRTSSEMAWPDFKRNPMALCSHRSARELPDFEQPCDTKSNHNTDRRSQNAELDLGEHRPGRENARRKEEADGEAARCRKRDHQQLTPADMFRRMKSGGQRDAGSEHDAKRAPYQLGGDHGP